MTDIHCHLVPGIDDGSDGWDETLAMARMAVEDGIGTIVATPHQCGAYPQNTGDVIRQAVAEVQARLEQEDIPLRVLPGGDVRIETDISQQLQNGQVLSLADRRKHVLLELPHELYFPLEPVLAQLNQLRMVGILSHPERNQGILNRPEVLRPLVEAGCLMQVTAGSLMGTFGPHIQRFAETMLTDGLVHFLATDAHGMKARRPLMRRALERAAELTSDALAEEICCFNPTCVAEGLGVVPGVRATRKRGFSLWRRRRAS